jgi:hypothetical protein
VSRHRASKRLRALARRHRVASRRATTRGDGASRDAARRIVVVANPV